MTEKHNDETNILIKEIYHDFYTIASNLQNILQVVKHMQSKNLDSLFCFLI